MKSSKKLRDLNVHGNLRRIFCAKLPFGVILFHGAHVAGAFMLMKQIFNDKALLHKVNEQPSSDKNPAIKRPYPNVCKYKINQSQFPCRI